MNELIWNQKELNNFVTNYMPELADDEVYFLSLVNLPAKIDKYLEYSDKTIWFHGKRLADPLVELLLGVGVL